MHAAWFWRPDWPSEFELQRRADLMDAVRTLPGSASLSDDDAEAMALKIWAASNYGRDEELPRNRPASQRVSERELEHLVELASKLAEHIKTMHRPAIDALWRETEGSLWDTARRIEGLAVDARHALGGVMGDASARGAGRKAEASAVAEAAERIFVRVTGRRATFTSDPATGRVHGPWVDFLAATFKALRLDASAESMARSLSARNGPRSGINLS